MRGDASLHTIKSDVRMPSEGQVISLPDKNCLKIEKDRYTVSEWTKRTALAPVGQGLTGI
jgi:hypothetical protein